MIIGLPVKSLIVGFIFGKQKMLGLLKVEIVFSGIGMINVYRRRFALFILCYLGFKGHIPNAPEITNPQCG